MSQRKLSFDKQCRFSNDLVTSICVFLLNLQQNVVTQRSNCGILRFVYCLEYISMLRNGIDYPLSHFIKVTATFQVIQFELQDVLPLEKYVLAQLSFVNSLHT